MGVTAIVFLVKIRVDTDPHHVRVVVCRWCHGGWLICRQGACVCGVVFGRCWVRVWCVGMLLGVWGNTLLCVCLDLRIVGSLVVVASWCVGVVCENWRVDASIDQACSGRLVGVCLVV